MERAGPGSRPTLEEVGDLAGVSRATVSRVINNSPRVSDEVRTAVERAIEERLATHLGGDRPTFGPLGRYRSSSFLDAYVAWLAGAVSIEGAPRVCIDAANGAAAVVASRVLEAAGARVIGAIGVEPDGENINAGLGALHPERLGHLVLATGADLGLAFDGDADRLIAVAPSGAVVDGDDVLVIVAEALAADGRLAGPGVVATVMSHLGLERTLGPQGIAVERTGVGDREVAGGLVETGYGLGGEQSGHIIFPALAPTGDGLLTALMLLQALGRLGVHADEALAARVRYPQIHRKVQARHGRAVLDSELVVEALRKAEERLGEEGRFVVRPSGTEPIVRIMVEATTEPVAIEVAESIEAAVRLATSTLGD